MRFTVEIGMDNAAFEENDRELGDILRKLAEHSDNVHLYVPSSNVLRDHNGNVTGHWRVDE